MSLINQMLSDLEARRAGSMESGARALDGLQPVFVAMPAAPAGALLRMAPGALAGLLAAVVAWYCLQTFERRPAPTAGAAAVDVAPASATAARSAPPTAVIDTVQTGPAATGALAADFDLAQAYALDAAPQLAEVKPVDIDISAAPALTSTPAQAEPTVSLPAEPAAPATQAPDVAPPEVEYRGTLRKDAHVLDEPSRQLQSAIAHLRNHAVAEGLAELAALLAAQPGYTQARQAYATELVRQRDLVSAERTLREGLALDPHQHRYAEMLAHLMVDRGEVDAALEILKAAQPDGDPEYLAFIAALEQRLTHHGLAIAAYRAALEAVPGRGAWWVGLGISLAADQQEPAARTAFERALADTRLSDNLRLYAKRELERIADPG